MNARPRSLSLRVVAASMAAVLIAFIGCSDEVGVVGGSCIDPYVQCGHECVDLATDPAHCGSCENACPSGLVCFGARCRSGIDDGSVADVSGDRSVTDGNTGDAIASDAANDANPDGSVDGNSIDGSSIDGSSVDGSGSDGAVGDGSIGDGSGGDSGPKDGASGDACVPPFTTNDHCGDCFTKCQGVNDTCRLGGGGVYACGPFCAPPLSRCGNQCVNLQNDGDNCGVCGRVCQSNICINGVCQGAASGDIVYIGHDYAATPVATSQGRALENAILLAPKTPVRVLAYQRYASASAITRVTAILADAATRSGRAVQVTTTTNDATVAAATTAKYEVVLVYDQVTAPAGAMGTLGTTWAAPLAAFTHVTGILVVLDGATGRGEMPSFITQTGLLSVPVHTAVGTGELVDVVAATDGVALGVVTPFATRLNSSYFATEANNGRVSWVAVHRTSAQPVIVHKIAP